MADGDARSPNEPAEYCVRATNGATELKPLPEKVGSVPKSDIVGERLFASDVVSDFPYLERLSRDRWARDCIVLSADSLVGKIAGGAIFLPRFDKK